MSGKRDREAKIGYPKVTRRTSNWHMNKIIPSIYSDSVTSGVILRDTNRKEVLPGNKSTNEVEPHQDLATCLEARHLDASFSGIGPKDSSTINRFDSESYDQILDVLRKENGDIKARFFPSLEPAS